MEPIFVPRSAGTSQSAAAPGTSQSAPPAASREDDGWLLCTVYDAAAGRGTLCIFDAAAVAAGPLARITLPHHLPSGLHGSWSPQCFGPGAGEAVPLWRAPNRIRAL